MDNNVRLKPDPMDFVQVTRGYLRDLRELSRKSPAAWNIFSLLTERMNKGNAVVISQATIAQILGYTRQTVNKAVSLLESERWLQVVKIGQSNAYILNSKVVWRDHSGKRYAGFFAEVVAAESEQTTPIEDWDRIELRQVPLIGSKEQPLIDQTEELPPPDQLDLIPPDSSEFPRSGIEVIDRESGEIHRNLLEDN